MSTLRNVDWQRVLHPVCDAIEAVYGVELEVDTDELAELERFADESLRSYRLTNPNAAKVAGHLCFWLRRLKPIRHAATSNAKLLAVNEVAALWLGLAICDQYFDNASAQSFKIDPRILKDWVASLRYNSHSPHALAIAFEILTGRKVE
ncbi:hypothetical protein [Azospirillum sp.]|uniref:hypothetical protein n=1 Tax=Azospirillum sp. TaxID=34012 RepID=UPI002D24DD0E|nr:hypothetical protein [Azospirillum sp.]HYD63925.1 hypothetical protein [Azospirillum sp.]